MEDNNSSEAATKLVNQEDPIIMYLIVRESLGMSIGKTAAQCAHASQMLQLRFQNLTEESMRYIDPDDPLNLSYLPTSLYKVIAPFKEWLDSYYRKVVLKASDKEWIKIKEEFPDHVLVIDNGLTEIPSGSETVIGLWPQYRSKVPKVIKKLQTLK